MTDNILVTWGLKNDVKKHKNCHSTLKTQHCISWEVYSVGGQGGLKLPPPVPWTPPPALFHTGSSLCSISVIKGYAMLQNFSQFLLVSRLLGNPASRPLSSRLPYPFCPLLSRPPNPLSPSTPPGHHPRGTRAARTAGQLLWTAGLLAKSSHQECFVINFHFQNPDVPAKWSKCPHFP